MLVVSHRPVLYNPALLNEKQQTFPLCINLNINKTNHNNCKIRKKALRHHASSTVCFIRRYKCTNTFGVAIVPGNNVRFSAYFLKKIYQNVFLPPPEQVVWEWIWVVQVTVWGKSNSGGTERAKNSKHLVAFLPEAVGEPCISASSWFLSVWLLKFGAKQHPCYHQKPYISLSICLRFLFFLLPNSCVVALIIHCCP